MGTLLSRIQSLDLEVTALERSRQTFQKDLSDLERQISHLMKESDLLSKVEQTLQSVSAKVLGQSTKTIDKLVTAGLKIVFHDQNLEFRTQVDKYRGKTSIKFELFEDGKTAPLMESFGGGPIVLIGVLLRVVTIVVLGQRRILFLDESLSHLSEQYHEQASALLKKLCKELGFTILMVTHQSGFVQHADVHYAAKRTAAGTVFERVTKSS